MAAQEKPKNVKVSQRQKEALIDFMGANFSVLFGKFSSSSGKIVKDKKWNEITNQLNLLGPPTKDIEKWKRVRILVLFICEFLVVLKRFECLSNALAPSDMAGHEKSNSRQTQNNSTKPKSYGCCANQCAAFNIGRTDFINMWQRINGWQ